MIGERFGGLVEELPRSQGDQEKDRELTEVVGIIRGNSSADDDGFQTTAIKVLSHVAALLQDTGFANAVAEACIERLAIDQGRQTTIAMIHRLLECSAAETDKVARRLFLSRKLEQICYTITKPELLAEIVGCIEELKLISPGSKIRSRAGACYRKAGDLPFCRGLDSRRVLCWLRHAGGAADRSYEGRSR